jgi:hypothetical protein
MLLRGYTHFAGTCGTGTRTSRTLSTQSRWVLNTVVYRSLKHPSAFIHSQATRAFQHVTIG